VDGVAAIISSFLTRFRAQANRLRYDAREKLLLLEGNEKVAVEFNWLEGDDRVASKLTARRMVVWLSERRFQVEDADCVFQKGKCGKGKPASSPKTEDD